MKCFYSYHYCVYIFFLFVLSSCSVKNEISSESGFSGQNLKSVFISNQRVLELRDRIESRAEPNWTAWLQLKKQCELSLNQRPRPVKVWAVKGYYDDPIAHIQDSDLLQKDAVAAYRLALCYRIVAESKYADKSLDFIKAWAYKLRSADLKKADTKLTMSRLFPMMIVAMDLLKEYSNLSIEFSSDFKLFLRKVVLPLNSMNDMNNNHANWGMLLVLSSSVYLKDEKLFNSTISRFKELIHLQITKDGILHYEIDRSDTKDWNGGPTKGINGVWYTNYTLMPYVLCAEILLLNGIYLYDYQSKEGGKIEKAFSVSAEWSVFPELFPYYESNGGKINGTDFVSYFEILNPIWKNNNSTLKINILRPLDYEISFPNLTFTHGDLGPDFSNYNSKKTSHKINKKIYY